MFRDLRVVERYGDLTHMLSVFRDVINHMCSPILGDREMQVAPAPPLLE